MRTENSDSEKDLNANPESSLNTNKPVSKPERVPDSGRRRNDRFPESQQARDEMERMRQEQQKQKEKDDDIELLANDVVGTVSSRDTGSNPEDIAGVADIDRGMRRSRRK